MGLGDEYPLNAVGEDPVTRYKLEADPYQLRQFKTRTDAPHADDVERYVKEVQTYVEGGDTDTDFLKDVEYGLGVSDRAGGDTWHIDAVDRFRRTVNEFYEKAGGLEPFLGSLRLTGVMRLRDEMADWPNPQGEEERKQYFAVTRLESPKWGPQKEDTIDWCRNHVKEAVTGG